MERRAAITGAGISQIGRKLMRPPMDLLLDAALAALADAGLSRDDIDGITSYPGRVSGHSGFGPIGVLEVRAALGLRTRWHSGGSEGPGQTSALMIAAMAVATGLARHVLVFRALTESSSQASGRQGIGQGDAEIGGWLSWLVPAGAPSAANWSAMFARRRMHEFGATREQIAQQVLLQRANAQLNPAAIMHGKPLDMDEYMGARMISDPLCLFDCDVPIDGAAVVIVSAVEAARDLRKPPLVFEAMGAGLFDRESWDQKQDLTTMAAYDAAQSLWARTDLKPGDVDVAGLYDGFSVFVPMWLEAYGFCGHGEGEAFIADGHTRRDGTIPTNTGGGQLSAGRLHGYGHLHEVCLQLWGEAGERQIAGAQTGVVGMGGGPLAGTVLLTRR
ncbi:MAG: thiolase family protein [Sphingobium sp.]